ncbi:MAG: exonuclease SbcCD subunit D [Eubacteriales bacterium]|nr:exonuclease SbcCD subunit D [Eubacteriales bacterium]
MKFLHVADLHIGRKIEGVHSLIEDQRHILKQVLSFAKNVDAVLIAGDVYDKTQPAQEALELFGSFLYELSKLHKPVFIISGNHDNAAQIAYLKNIISDNNIFVSPPYAGELEKFTLQDEYGQINIWLMPFLRPFQVKRHLDENISGYDEAISAAIEHENIDFSKRNVLIMHQFVLGGERSDSEERSIGGLDCITTDAIMGFDYVALGHLHKCQRAGSDNIRYSGSPLAYSLSEEKHQKCALIIDIKEKGDINIQKLPFEPIRKVRTLEGYLKDLVKETDNTDDFVYVVLKDDPKTLFDPGSAILSHYKNNIGWRYIKTEGEAVDAVEQEFDENKSLIEHFGDFYAQQHFGEELDEERLKIIKQAIKFMEENP